MASPDSSPGSSILGTSASAESLRRAAVECAATQENLVLEGEPGTGKRFLARTLAQRRGARTGRLVTVDPSTGEDELRVILFEEDRRRIEGMLGKRIHHLNPGDTLYVRNPLEFSILGQTRLARFLIQTDPAARRRAGTVRVIFALWDGEEIPRPGGRGVGSLSGYLRDFRRIVLPPLRERREDIPGFIDHFLATDHAPRMPVVVPGDTLDRLSMLPYRGNIRELRMILHEAVEASPGNMLRLPPIVLDEVEEIRSLLHDLQRERAIRLEATLDAVERALIRRALIRCGSNRARAASLLGLTELHIRYRIKKHGLGGVPGEGGGNCTPEDLEV